MIARREERDVKRYVKSGKKMKEEKKGKRRKEEKVRSRRNVGDEV
jgi:hypothetical protein